jgi:hypothetical protein
VTGKSGGSNTEEVHLVFPLQSATDRCRLSKVQLDGSSPLAPLVVHSSDAVVRPMAPAWTPIVPKHMVYRPSLLSSSSLRRPSNILSKFTAFWCNNRSVDKTVHRFISRSCPGFPNGDAPTKLQIRALESIPKLGRDPSHPNTYSSLVHAFNRRISRTTPVCNLFS